MVNPKRGGSLLPTFLFILGAYGCYALYNLWSWRRKKGLRDLRRNTKTRPLILTGFSLAVGCIIVLCIWLAPPSPQASFNLAGILGLGHNQSWLTARADQPLKKPLMTNSESQDRPAYALLHPETPAALILKENPEPSRTPHRKPKKRKLRRRASKKTKVKARSRVTKKVSGKNRVKKKGPKLAIISPELMQLLYSR
jgi:hypothetical protein